MRDLIEQFLRHRAAPMTREVMTHLTQQFLSVMAGEIPLRSTQARGEHLVILAAFHKFPEQGRSHGTAAGVAGADKEDAFQNTMRISSKGSRTCRAWRLCQKRGKITPNPRRVNCGHERTP